MRSSPIVAIAEDCELPNDEQHFDALLNDLRETFEKHNVSPEALQIYDGNIHSQTCFDRRCPECDDRLKLSQLTPDNNNGAAASAHCSCGWTGRALYRLIDLQEPDTDDGVQQTLTEDSHEIDVAPESCVQMGKIDVSYVPYPGTESRLL
jgi:hypothetical protein